MNTLEDKVKMLIRNVPDFPSPGIQFKDITPILEYPDLCYQIAENMAKKYTNDHIEAIVSIESRGFFFGTLLSQILQIPQFIVRKKGKLPYKTISQKYDLEYGSSEIEMHIDNIKPGMKVLIHDDLLATGGTAEATGQLILKQKGIISGFAFLIDLIELDGMKRLNKLSPKITTFVTF